MNDEQKQRIEKLETLLREVKTALLASGWRYDYIIREIDVVLAKHPEATR